MTLKYTAESTIETVMSTELDALANDDQAISSSAYSNDDILEREMWVVVELYIAAQAGARTAAESIMVAIIPELDDVNYADWDDANLIANYVKVTFEVDAALTATRFVSDKIKLPNSDYKWAVRQQTDQAFGATGNTLKVKTFSYTDA